MAEANHYETLKVSRTATPEEIKQAYRRLVKRYHPDRHPETACREQIIRINAAYEVLGDGDLRHSYDRQLREGGSPVQQQPERTEAAHRYYRQSRQASSNIDQQVQRWLEQVYHPLNGLFDGILHPLDDRIEDLSADPFDDELMEEFCAYIRDCHHLLRKAQISFRSLPNPASLAGVAAELFYCLNQLEDGIEELEYFTLNYDDRCLHRGWELFRIAAQLQETARSTMSSFF